jgi:cytochrome b subunit of formate dehydrogenase
MCHAETAEKFNASVHGKAVAAGGTEAPVCTSCHGEHSILSPKSEGSTVHAGHVRETCARCHGDVRLSRKFGMPADRVVSFDASFHGLAAKSGSQSVANCASCHGFHDVLPSKDVGSKTNARNLPRTCGQCHPGAGQRFALGRIHHVEGGRTEHAAVRWVRIGYLVLIPLLLGAMLLHNAGDFLRKLVARRFRGHRPHAGSGAPKSVRMYGFERVQHALLASSFLLLVWTGFALKYPDQWWAWPLVAGERQFPVRGTVHRVAAVVFLIVAAMHAGSLVVSRRLRDHWKELLPARRDVPDALLGFAYNLGLTRRKPRLPSHSYIEKMEYWAVLWGGVVMALTGFILWFNNWSLAWLPLWAIDAATAVHLYEAVLATLAIVVWHFYGVIFDPDVYPLETTFLTGVSVKEEEEEPEAAETTQCEA